MSPEDDTSAISRDHTIHISRSGLLTIAGGKWTTYRKMAEDTIDCAAVIGELAERACVTRELRLHGHTLERDEAGGFAAYGADAAALRALVAADERLAEQLHPEFDYRAVQVVWAARHEMARTLEDVLARRLRALFLDTRASLVMAPRVAQLLAAELGRDHAWEQAQVEAFRAVAEPLLVQ
jgi:glycerol-3-phosphate dehydrogenase